MNKIWITSSKYTKIQIIRYAGEEYNPNYIKERESCKNRQIFQGCFLDELGKDPYLFQKKEQISRLFQLRF